MNKEHTTLHFLTADKRKTDADTNHSPLIFGIFRGRKKDKNLLVGAFNQMPPYSRKKRYVNH